ncbi:MAG TPA: hypothetical protein VF185_02390 [Patescibacteria group bacterium]
MLLALIIVLFLLWLLGYGPFTALRLGLFAINGRTITLWDLFIFGVIVWIITALPSPLKEIASVVLILWLLSLFGILALAGLSNLLVIAIIVGLIVYVVSGV